MSAEYSRDMMKVAVAKMLQTVGWNTTHSTPSDVLTDLIVHYITQIGKLTNEYANEFGFIEPNLDHLGLAFRDYHINLNELEEYVTFVNFALPPVPVPKYPVETADNLNFLKPGSQEVVTRPVHIHEHLPPMFQINEEIKTEDEEPVKTEESEELPDVDSTISPPFFKRPAEVSPNEPFKKSKLHEEEGRPTREISSVMMTTSGFISPAREGKLPESRTPITATEPPPPQINPEPIPTENITPTKPVKKLDKKKDKVGKELFKQMPDEKSPKKTTTMKDVVKLKQLKAATSAANTPSSLLPGNVVGNTLPGLTVGVGLSPVPNTVISPRASSPNQIVLSGTTIIPIPNNLSPSEIKPALPLNSPKGNNSVKMNKALAAARLKTEKLNTTITPVPIRTPSDVVDKLFTEPDKKKVNILKKISNVKNEKSDVKPVKGKDDKQESRESSPDLIIDESNDIGKMHIPHDITIELIDTPQMKSENVDRGLEHSPVVSNLVPKSAEIIGMPPLPKSPVKEKRKRKESQPRAKKLPKRTLLNPVAAYAAHNHAMNLDGPKPLDAHLRQQDLLMSYPPRVPPPGIPPMFPYLPTLTGPGLIPNPLASPLFANMNLPLQPSFGQASFMPPIHHQFLIQQIAKQQQLQQQIQQQQQHQQQQHQQQQHKQQEHVQQEKQKHIKEEQIKVLDKVKDNLKKTEVINEDRKSPVHQPLLLPAKEIIKEAPPPVVLKTPIAPPSPTVTPSNQQQSVGESISILPKVEKKVKEHKKEKKDKIKKKNKKDKVKNKAEKKKIKEEKKDKVKKEKKEKRKDKDVRDNIEVAIPKLTLKLGTPSPRPETPDTKKLNIKPVVKKTEEDTRQGLEPEVKREMSPELAKISALVTGQPKPKANAPSNVSKDAEKDESTTAQIQKTQPGPPRPKAHPPKYARKSTKANKRSNQLPVKDSEGNEVWICPACGRQDDGSPMIGCDDCDAWYHWVCVGIQVPPDDNEDWYCKFCITKKQEVLQTDKKKKRKKKEKKEH